MTSRSRRLDVALEAFSLTPLHTVPVYKERTIMADTSSEQVRRQDYHSPLSRMLYDSPLHRLSGKIALVVIMVVIVLLSSLIWSAWLTPLSNARIVLLAVAVAFLGSLVGLVWIRYLDRREPESWWYWIGVLVFAMLFCVTPAVVFNSISPFVFTVGFNEEFWKVVPLLLLILFAPTTVNGVRDGMIYGALGGFAFNVVEIADFFLLDSYPERGIAGLSESLARLSFWGIGNHVIWSMLVGAGIGLAVQAQNRRTKMLAPLGAYLLAALTHGLQDMGVGVILMAAALSMLLFLQGADVDMNDPAAGQELINPNLGKITQIETILINIIILPIIVIFLLRSGNWERQVIHDGLADERDAVITPEVYQGVKAEKRFRLRHIPDFPRRVGRQIRNAQNRLAFHKAYLKRKSRPIEGDPLIEYYRAEVIRHRSEAEQKL